MGGPQWEAEAPGAAMEENIRVLGTSRPGLPQADVALGR